MRGGVVDCNCLEDVGWDSVVVCFGREEGGCEVHGVFLSGFDVVVFLCGLGIDREV